MKLKIGAFLFMPLAFVSAQQKTTSHLNLKLAELTEDVLLVQDQLKQLRQDIEFYSNENKQIKQALHSLQKESPLNHQTLNDFALSFENKLTLIANKINQTHIAQKKNILRQVNSLIEDLRKQVQEGFTKLTIQKNVRLVSTKDNNKTIEQVEFSHNYPKNGIEYNVAAGDTLSNIAKKFGSKVSYIKNANKIVDPKNLQIGKTLFVPQDKKE